MNDTAVIIGVLYGGAVLVGTLVLIAIATSARKPAHVDHAVLARRENTWFVIVVVLLTVLLLSTIWLTPYGDEDESAARAAAGGSVAVAPRSDRSWKCTASSSPGR